MPTYVYRCQACFEEKEETFAIGTARSLMACECGSMMRQVLGVGVAYGVSETTTTANRKDSELSLDLAAYKRMRDNGLQPKGIDGSRFVENEVGDQMDIDRARAFKLDPKRSREGVKDAIIEGYEMAAQIKAESDV